MRRANSQLLVLSCLLVALAAAGPLEAQLAVSTARGQVVDTDGTPLKGAVVTFWPKSNPQMEYSGTTNKKGRYAVSGLYTPQQGDRWLVRVELDGHVATRVVVESRTASKVLAGDIMTQALAPGQQVPEFGVRPLGTVQVDFTMGLGSAIAAAPVAPAGQAAPAGASGAAAPAVPTVDPWDAAVTLAGQGRLEDSVPRFEEAIADEPDDAERREAFAKVLYRLERLDDALDQAARATELDPQRVDSWMVQSSVHAARERFDEAASVLAAASDAAPDDLRILERRALLAKRRGAADEARGLYERITELDPENAAAWLALGDHFAEAGDSQRSEAAFQAAVALDPSNAHQIYYNLGALIMNRDDRSSNDTRRAVDALRRATEIKPDYGLAHRQLAFALLELGDRAGAAASLEAYVAAAPDSADAAQMKGLAQSLKN